MPQFVVVGIKRSKILREIFEQTATASKVLSTSDSEGLTTCYAILVAWGLSTEDYITLILIIVVDHLKEPTLIVEGIFKSFNGIQVERDALTRRRSTREEHRARDGWADVFVAR